LNPPGEALSPLRRKDEAPLFDEPWQAQALAMADLLVQSGAIGAQDWADRLGAHLKQAAASALADDADAYYGAVLAALEDLLYTSGALEPSQVARFQEQWKRAYLNTPHGSEVELSAGDKPTVGARMGSSPRT
jgi:nitrile hydratase accessory protein